MVLGLVIFWRVALLVFTAQPIPANDSACFDGPVINWLVHGGYFNPAMSVAFPISGTKVFSAYPPMYQAVLLVWMKAFGTTVISAMAFHVALFASAGTLCFLIIRRFFPAGVNYSLPLLFLLVVTFDDRPESLAHNFGLLSLLLVVQTMADGPKVWRLVSLSLVLLAALYTSVIVGAVYFGAGFLAVTVGSIWRRRWIEFLPFIATAVLFAVITTAIVRLEPLWWAGFQENARNTTVVMDGLRMPEPAEIIKLVRNVPVFVVALALLPMFVVCRKRWLTDASPWLFLLAGIALMGWLLLAVAMTWLAPNYVFYVMYLQVLLAAGMLALRTRFFPDGGRWLPWVFAGCLLVVSVRAVGLSTWGVACAAKNPYSETKNILAGEFAPFTTNHSPVLIASAFLYEALNEGVKNPIHSDWFYDRVNTAEDAGVNGLIAVRPVKMVLTQRDYFGPFQPMLEVLQQRPGLVEIQVTNYAKVRAPEYYPSLRRVVQHVSWAPVIVDLKWSGPLTVTNSAPGK